MRKRDKPGSYRILDRGGEFVVSGVLLDGKRFKSPAVSRSDAEALAATLFPQGIGGNPPVPREFRSPLPPTPKADDNDWSKPTRPGFDEFGLPVIRNEGAASLNASMGLGGSGQSGPSVSQPTPPVDADKKAKQVSQAKSLMELAGVGWAAGSVWAGRALCERLDRDAPNPSATQVKDLSNVTKDTFTEMFGDKEIKPWQLMVLLTLGIPISMLLQARPRKKSPEQLPGLPNLTSVPSR